jgi:hypothetical protein
MKTIPDARIDETRTQRAIGPAEVFGAVSAGVESDEFTKEKSSSS